MPRKWPKTSSVTVFSQVKEYENVFHVDNGLLFFIEDLIEAFANADIPLEKINLLLPFFKKHLKEGGAIPQASTLRQIYLPKVFNKHQENLKLFFDSKPISIIRKFFITKTFEV
ncbi:hypothetical protein Glove_123g3 [Diversispora epigaea]|uniref:Uncharacterized protein n=1 Tax=Diversispora epigaea TaxID=1348612 RepID=A0A397J2P5_9GLOM|nr:hypothetical protein Glove_123g3 [Diversispora epigaea]